MIRFSLHNNDTVAKYSILSLDLINRFSLHNNDTVAKSMFLKVV
ncbi:MAG: hypothetical protein ACRCVI_01035 [Mycoplasmoidaceae bacterium]